MKTRIFMLFLGTLMLSFKLEAQDIYKYAEAWIQDPANLEGQLMKASNMGIERLYDNDLEYYQAWVNGEKIDPDDIIFMGMSDEAILFQALTGIGAPDTKTFLKLLDIGMNKIFDQSYTAAMFNGAAKPWNKTLYSKTEINGQEYTASINVRALFSSISSGYKIEWNNFTIEPSDIESNGFLGGSIKLLFKTKVGSPNHVASIPSRFYRYLNQPRSFYFYRQSADVIKDYVAEGLVSLDVYVFDDYLLGEPKHVGTFSFTEDPVHIPAAPVSLISKNRPTSVFLSWQDMESASYKIYRGTSEQTISKSNFLATTSSKEYDDLTAKNGIKYYYAVMGIDNDGNESRFSNIVSGMAKTELRLETNQSYSYSVATNSDVIITGKVKDNSGNYLEEVEVYLTDSLEHNWKSKSTFTDSNGEFSIKYKTSPLAGNYKFVLNCLHDKTSIIRPVSIRSNYNFNSVQLLELHQSHLGCHPGNKLTLTATIKNHFANSISSGKIDFKVISIDNDTLGFATKTFNLGSMATLNVQQNFNVPAIPEGIYEIIAEIHSIDEVNTSDNVIKSEVFVSNVNDNSKFYLSKYSNIDINTSANVNGHSVKPTYITNEFADFLIDNTYFVTVLKDKFKYLSQVPMFIEYKSEIGDTLITFNAGVRSSYTINNQEISKYAGDDYSLNISVGSGINLKNQINFWNEDKSDYSNWLTSVQNGSGENRKVINFTVPWNYSHGQYSTWAYLRNSEETKTYIFKVNTDVIPLRDNLDFESHSITNRSVSSQSLSKLPGDLLEAETKFGNDNNFYKEKNCRVFYYITSESDSLAIGTNDFTLIKNSLGSQSMSFNTQGLDLGQWTLNYEYSSNWKHGKRYDRSVDFELDEIPEFEAYIVDISTLTELQNDIKSQIILDYNSNSIEGASVVGTLKNPLGETRFLSYEYDNTSQTYQTNWPVNYGGWYYADIEVSHERFQPVNLFEDYRGDVKMSLEVENIESTINSFSDFNVRLYPCGNIAAISGEITYDKDSLELELIEETPALRNSNTKVILNEVDGVIYFGISTLSDQYETSFQDITDLFHFRFLNKKEGKCKVKIENLHCFDKYENAITILPSEQTIIVKPIEVFFDLFSRNDTVFAGVIDTLYLNTINPVNVSAISCDVTFNKSALLIDNVFEGNLFNEDGEVQTAFINLINDSTINLNLARLGANHGLNNSGKTIGISYLPIREDSVSFTISNIKVVGLHEEISFNHSFSNESVIIKNSQRAIPNFVLEVSEDSISINDTLIVDVKLSNISSLTGYALDLNFYPLGLKFISAEKGTFLSSSNSTFFNSYLDSINGKVIIGESILGSSQTGVSSESPVSLCTVKLCAKTKGESIIHMNNEGLLGLSGLKIDSENRDTISITITDTINIPTLDGTAKNYFENIVLYPNPVKELLNYRLPAKVSPERIVICDLYGVVRKELIPSGYIGNINVSKLNSGIYILRFYTKEKKIYDLKIYKE